MEFYSTEFLVMMDYIEDISVIKDPDKPSAIHLYQVKTKSAGKQYLLSTVISEKWFQKLYSNAKKYGTYTSSASVVCNTDVVASSSEVFPNEKTSLDDCTIQTNISKIRKAIFTKKGLASSEIKSIISFGLAVQIPSLEKLFSEFAITSLRMKSRCSSQYRQIKIDMYSDMQVFINLKQAVIRSVEEACNSGIDDMPSLLADVYKRTSGDNTIPTAYRDEYYLKTLIMILAYKYCYGGGIV